MQFIISVVLLMACSYLGYAFGNFYKLREQFLQDLVNFTQILRTEIGFSKEHLLNILKQKKYNFRPQFASFLKSYAKCLEKEDIPTLEVIKANVNSIYLDEKEQVEVHNLFSFLGTTDSISQINNLSNYLVFFEMFLKDANKEKKKYVGTYSKLGFLTGVFLVILLL